MIKSRAFQTLAIAITILSTIVLAAESPVPVTSKSVVGNVLCTLQDTLLYIDMFILTWFLLEMVLKVGNQCMLFIKL